VSRTGRGERAAALTRELLTLARRQVLQPQIVDVNTITGGLVSFLDKVIARDIELKVITSPVDPVKASFGFTCRPTKERLRKGYRRKHPLQLMSKCAARKP
jgi:hypothetical protein